jgi:hypothetical protein
MEDEIAREIKPEEQEMLARFQEELRRMTVGEHLVTMMQSLATLAVRRMGLTPQTAAERDLDQAKLAIEAFRTLLSLVEPVRPQEEMRAHRKMLSELQMAFVGALQQAQTGDELPQDAQASNEVPPEEALPEERVSDEAAPGGGADGD